MTLAAVHHWIVVLDIEGFSTRPNPVQRSLRQAMYEVLRDALAEAGLPDGAVATEDRGDGVLVLVQPQVSPVLLAGALVRALDDCLAEKARIFNEAHALRLRVALHQGLVSRDADGWSGDAVNWTFRLVDAAPLREVLARAGRANLAFIVSDEVYQAVVRHEYRTVDPAAYLPVGFEAKHGIPARGWITVPGYPAPPGLDGGSGPGTGLGPGPAAAPAAPAPAPGSGGAPTGGVVFHAGVVHGDQVAGDKNVHHAPNSPGRR
ncbi:hypothetical protein BX285_1923 [Streptomyces sp. 1114.5]|uniref:hypothetical protein n=1 Tax=Streptomyces sp. 1114.5 TaxID=1938830 RepID=UPI000EB1FCB3|nr:hypothetical protein [Streptomyces sp. 1114.5]RKT17546.1 hypothetical protein BX285_1923 [Streptomyces sp. 1114.5]